MTEERIIVTLKDDGEYCSFQSDNLVVLDGWFEYEPNAPPKGWIPFCATSDNCGSFGTGCDICTFNPKRKRE